MVISYYQFSLHMFFLVKGTLAEHRVLLNKMKENINKYLISSTISRKEPFET